MFAFAMILLFDSFAQAADSDCWITGGATLYDKQIINETLKAVVSWVDRPFFFCSCLYTTADHDPPYELRMSCKM
jgi:hypothetical protein